MPHTGKGRGRKILLPFQLAVLLGMSITYVLVGGENLMAFAKAITPAGGDSLGKYAYIIMFGCVELFLSMVSVGLSVPYCTNRLLTPASVWCGRKCQLISHDILSGWACEVQHNLQKRLPTQSAWLTRSRLTAGCTLPPSGMLDGCCCQPAP